jgi:colanic acid biosynthesis glycosyl transferase WcaI
MLGYNPPVQSHPDVLLLSVSYPPEQTGIAPYAGALASALADLGYQVSANVSHPHYPEWAVREGYGQFTRAEVLDGVAVARHRHYVPVVPRGLRRLLYELTFGARLFFSRMGRPRLVIAVSPALFSTAIAILRVRLTSRRTPVVLWVQDIYTLGLSETGEGGEAVRKVTRWVEGRTVRAADRVVVIHQRFADYLIKEFCVDPLKIAVIRNWTHLEEVEKVADSDAAKEQLGWPSGVILAVHTGNMGAKQGLENILDAARVADELAAPVHFILVGDGGERRKLEELASGISRLSFVPPLDDEQYRLALAAADVLLVNEKPGVSAMAVPSKLTAYFDAGRPVVAATDPEGITAAEVTAAGAGVVVPAAEPRRLLDAVMAIGADPQGARQYGLNGLRYRQQVLGQDAAIAQFQNLIRAVGSSR